MSASVGTSGENLLTRSACFRRRCRERRRARFALVLDIKQHRAERRRRLNASEREAFYHDLMRFGLRIGENPTEIPRIGEKEAGMSGEEDASRRRDPVNPDVASIQPGLVKRYGQSHESSREAPSHRECHCTAPGSARTHAPRAWKQPGTQGCVQPSQRGTCIFKLICQTLRPLTHLHMSPAVAAQEVMRGDRSYAAAPGSLEGRSHHVTGKETEKCLSFSRQPPR